MDPSDPLGINKYSEMMRQSQEPLVEALRQLNGITQRVQIESPLSKLVIESQFQQPLPEYLRQMDIIRQQNVADLVRSSSGFESQRYTNLMNDQLKQLQISQANLTPLFDIQSSFDRIRVQVSDFTDKIKSGLGRALEGLAAISPSLLDMLRLFGEEREVWLNQQMVDTLKYYGWWHVPSMPQELIEEVFTMAEEGKGRSVSARICRHYRENDCVILASVVETWGDISYFNRRRHIFRAALRGYKGREYLLVVPALLPLIEGIVRDFLSDLGITEWHVHWQAVVQIMTLSQPRPKVILVNSFCDLLTQIVFGDFSPQQTYNSTSLKRHPVMHGRTVSYGTQKTALLAFLALDTLHHYLQTLLREHSISDLSATYQTAVQDAKAAKKPNPRPKRAR